MRTHFLTIVWVVMVGWLSAVRAEETNVPPPDIPIAAMLEASSLLEQVQNPSVKAYLQRRLDGIFALSNVTERVSRFDGFLHDLKSAPPVSPAAGALGAKPAEAPRGMAAPPPVATTNPPAGAMDVEALNLLTKYACILYDLENRGFDVVRKELLDNINATGLQPETMTMLRQLVMICDEAERALSSMKNIKEDSAAETKALWWQNLGTYGATSVATADPLPLLQAAASIVKGRQKVTVERDRKLDSEVQNHRGRLVNFLFELNLRRSSAKTALGVDETEFLTKEIYDTLQRALLDQDPASRMIALRQCAAKCPAFREGLYYLAAAHHTAGQFEDAEQCLRELTARKSVLLRSDGLLGGAYDILADYSLRRGDASNAVTLAKQALLNQPERGSAYNHLGLALMRLGEAPAAARALGQAIRLEPENGAYLWSAAQLAAVSFSNNDAALTFLEAAIQRGFVDFAAVYAFEPLRTAVASARGQNLLKPLLMVTCSKTLLNQQVAVSNLAPYPLTDVKLTLNLTQGTATGRRHETELLREVGVLSNGEVFVMSASRAGANGTRSLMRLTYTCAEHPTRTFETITCHNYLSQGETLWWNDYLARSGKGHSFTGEVSRAEAAEQPGVPLNSGQLRERLLRLASFPAGPAAPPYRK